MPTRPILPPWTTCSPLPAGRPCLRWSSPRRLNLALGVQAEHPGQEREREARMAVRAIQNGWALWGSTRRDLMPVQEEGMQVEQEEVEVEGRGCARIVRLSMRGRGRIAIFADYR